MVPCHSQKGRTIEYICHCKLFVSNVAFEKKCLPASEIAEGTTPNDVKEKEFCLNIKLDSFTEHFRNRCVILEEITQRVQNVPRISALNVQKPGHFGNLCKKKLSKNLHRSIHRRIGHPEDISYLMQIVEPKAEIIVEN